MPSWHIRFDLARTKDLSMMRLSLALVLRQLVVRGR